MPEVESQSTRRSGGECDERLRIRRLRIPVIDNSVRDLDVGMKIPFLKSSSIENGLFIMYLPIVSDYMRWQISARVRRNFSNQYMIKRHNIVYLLIDKIFLFYAGREIVGVFQQQDFIISPPTTNGYWITNKYALCNKSGA